MDTQTLQVFSLRGMDERWIVQPQDALFIEDMTWTSNDSWKTSGGFFQVYKPDPFFKTVSGQSPGSSSFDKINVAPEDNILYDYTGPIALKTEPVETDFIVDPSSPEVPYAYARFPKIKSLHWFAQHNGARQWLMMETQNGGAGSGLFGESYDLEEVDEHGVPINFCEYIQQNISTTADCILVVLLGHRLQPFPFILENVTTLSPNMYLNRLCVFSLSVAKKTFFSDELIKSMKTLSEGGSTEYFF